ncbi:unnamed protein product [Ectocarpus sp. 12 AP-2014]
MYRENGRTMQITNAVEHAKKLDDRSATTFGEKLDQVCDFDVIATAEKDSCSIATVMKEKYVLAAKREFKNQDPKSAPTDLECLQYILKEKLHGSTVADSTSDEVCWFNETDRLLQGIVSSEPGRGNGHGQMVVMRVYEKEEQRSMQHCLRQAMEKLEIHDGSPDMRPLFSVVSDNGDGNTSLSTCIEPYFLNNFNLLNAGAGEGTYTLKDRLEELQASHDLRGGRRTACLSYADLLNVPMILILCDKGRTGDTFPHTLGCFDLRIRTAEQSFATFEQELGRLCRYQTFMPIDGDEITECSHVQAIALGKKASAFRRKRVLKISSPSSKFLGVANTWWELDEILSDKAQAHPNVRVEESAFRLPTMLITTRVMDIVHNAINEHRKTNTPISKCIRMARMDQHMRGSMAKAKICDLHDYSRYRPDEGHYDSGRDKTSTRNERRLVLSAECQVGKTGAYLHYLKILKRAASPIATPPPPFPIVASSGDVVSWLLPHWRTLSNTRPLSDMYGSLFAGKYTAGVANSRAYLVVQSCKRDGWVTNFQEFLRNVLVHKVQGETINSEAGRRRIAGLEPRLEAPFDAEGQAIRTEASYASLKAAIDWDGRFHTNHGVQLCVCSGQCTPACQDSLAKLKVSYGAALSIRTADLAETGGRLDGVIARWEADQDNSQDSSQDDSQDPCELGDDFVAKQPPKAWNKGYDSQKSKHPFQYRAEGALQGLTVSTPHSFKGGIQELLRSKETTRWIFTPSFNRFLPGPRQALLDRSEALPKPLDGLDVGPRTHFGNHYVIMELPMSMPSDESPSSRYSPEEGGIGYTRHFIQRWSQANGIPFVWMLDDNVQLCHELDVGKEEAKYQPCSFTQVMNSLERLMLAEEKKGIRVSTASDKEGTTRDVLEYVKINGVRDEACPRESDLLRGDIPKQSHTVDQKITTVGDLCGRPGHYGVLGIARHGYGCTNNKEVKEPFGVTHSVYSFCLLNVASTVSKGAWYPMKRFWEDIEFNHIIDEKGLVVCKFRKFSHSKKNLQPIQPRQPRPPPTSPPAHRPLLVSCPEFQHDDIDLDELQRKYEKGSTCVTDLNHLDGLLKYLSEHVLQSIPIEEVCYPTGDRGVVTIDDRSFEIEPAALVPGNPQLALEPGHDSRSIVIMLLGGIRNESFGVLKLIIRDKHIGKWL